jgi:hypothetical protein
MADDDDERATERPTEQPSDRQRTRAVLIQASALRTVPASDHVWRERMMTNRRPTTDDNDDDNDDDDDSAWGPGSLRCPTWTIPATAM